MGGLDGALEDVFQLDVALALLSDMSSISSATAPIAFECLDGTHLVFNLNCKFDGGYGIAAKCQWQDENFIATW